MEWESFNKRKGENMKNKLTPTMKKQIEEFRDMFTQKGDDGNLYVHVNDTVKTEQHLISSMQKVYEEGRKVIYRKIKEIEDADDDLNIYEAWVSLKNSLKEEV